MRRQAARRTIENALRRRGFTDVAGADEVGRGALAGPVVAAAVVLDPCRHVAGLRDSKLLTAAQRERLYAEITTNTRWAVAAASSSEVDRLNVHRASLDALRRAVEALDPRPGFALVDGFTVPGLELPQRGVVGGDRRCAAIAAASIVAKVTRDREMVRLHAVDPRYGFDRHKGYATRMHVAAVARFGYSNLHRRSFRPRGL
jgi:ribonuclease HII